MQEYTLIRSKVFQKAFLKLVKSGLKKNVQKEIEKSVNKLLSGEKLGAEHRDHKLHGEYEGFRECHIQGDLLLVYKIEKKELVLLLINIGSHSYLF